MTNSQQERNSLSRTISNTFINSFNLGRKRSRDVSEESESTPSKSDEVDSSSNKKQKLNEEDEKKKKEFSDKEKEYDALLDPEYRKWRPKGYKLNPPPKDRPIRIYADGVFDLFHLGHMRQLEQCKKAFPNVELVVGIPNDKETHARKGLTVLTDKQRYDTVRHCRWVDEVIEDAPWILTMDFLKKHKIDYCAHDDLPYVADGIDDIYKPMKEAGMFVATQRTDGISTSDIITKIIRDYDKYLMRNFARGATREELNVSWLKKNELDLKKQINDFRTSWKKTNNNLSNMTKDLYTVVRESLQPDQHKGKGIKNTSPADKFALKYNGNGLSRTNSRRSLIDNIKDWVGMESHSEMESQAEDDEDDSSNKTFNNGNDYQKSESVDDISVKTPRKKSKSAVSTPKKTPRKMKTPKKLKK